jgi:hypothetical protein
MILVHVMTVPKQQETSGGHDCGADIVVAGNVASAAMGFLFRTTTTPCAEPRMHYLLAAPSRDHHDSSPIFTGVEAFELLHLCVPVVCRVRCSTDAPSLLRMHARARDLQTCNSRVPLVSYLATV